MTYEEVTKCFLGRVDKNKHKKEEHKSCEGKDAMQAKPT
jgi:hypothetical protein